MFSSIFEFFYNAFDPLYVDERCELQKEKDKRGSIIVTTLLFIVVIIGYIFDNYIR